MYVNAEMLGTNISIVATDSKAGQFGANGGAGILNTNNTTLAQIEDGATVTTGGASVIAWVDVASSVDAYVGAGAQVGVAAGKNVRHLTINAVCETNGEADALAVAAGIGLAGQGNQSVVRLTPTLQAFIGGFANVKVTGDLSVTATATPQADADTSGVSAGTVAVGVSLAEATVTPNVKSFVAPNATVVVGSRLHHNPSLVFKHVGKMTGLPSLTFDHDAASITRDTGNWLADGFAPGRASSSPARLTTI